MSKTDKSTQSKDTQGNGEKIQGLSSEQLTLLAQKVYHLLLEELRVENERQGSIGRR